MRFKDLSIRTKLMSGFMLVTLVIIIFGLINFSYMGKISGSLFSITDHYAKGVEYAAAIEKKTLATIIAEKDYLSGGKEQARKDAEANIKALTGFIDKLGNLAKKFNDKKLFEQSKAAGNNTRLYTLKYRKCVKILAENKKNIKAMVKSGKILEQSASALLKGDAQAYTSARKKGAPPSELDAYVQRYIMTNNIYGHTMKILRAEKQELKNRDRTAYNEMLVLFPQLSQLYDKLKKITADSEGQQLIAPAEHATKVYEKAMADWIKNDNNLKNVMAAQETKGSVIMKKAAITKKAADRNLEQQKIRAKRISARADEIIIIVLVVSIFLSIGLGLFFAMLITRPIKQGVDFVKKVSKGDLTQTLDIDQSDEIGQLAKAMNQMCKNLNKMFKELTQGVEVLSSSSTELSAISTQMLNGAEDTSGKSDSVAAAAEEMSSSMNSVAAASEQTSTNVQMVAAAAEEMSATIGEIARNTEQGTSITNDAVMKSEKITEKVGQLGNAAKQIDKITEVISEISEQTNLLALNATIEAARAGEAGKGFAVVAGEIKELAKQTASATHKIRENIEDIQKTTNATVGEIEEITTVIGDVNEIVTTITTAVKEQAEATAEIAGNVSQASLGIQDVNENVAESSTVAAGIAKEIIDVSQSSKEMSEASSQVNISAGEMSTLAEQIHGMTTRFRIN